MMDIEEILNNDMSQQMRGILIDSISQSEEQLNSLLNLSLSTNKKTAWRAAWLLSHVHDKAPDLLENKLDIISKHIFTCPFDGVNRSFLQILSKSDSIDYNVDLINLCFDWMISPQKPIAIQVYCMRILGNVCKSIPEFKQELIITLENIDINNYSKGFVSSRKNILKQLYKSK